MATTFTKPAPVAGLAQGVLVILAGFLPILAIVALTPAVPKMVGHFARMAGASTWVPLAVTAPGLMIALFSPLMGWLADRHGRRALLIWATLIYGFVGVAPCFLESLTAIFASRLALGLCEAAILTITNTLIADYYPEAGRRNWLMAQAAFGPIFGVSVLIGSGQLAALDWHMPFLIYAVALPIAGAMAIWLFEPKHQHASGDAPGHDLFPTRHIAVCGGVTLFGASLYYVYIVQIGLAFEGIGLHAADRVGMLVGLANIGVFLGGLAFRPLSIRLGAAGQIATFLGFMGAGMLGIGLAADITTMTLFASIQQFGAGILIPALVLWAMQGISPRHRGRAMGIWSACFFLGQFTSPLAVSLVRLGGATVGGAFAWLGSLAVICAAVAALRAGTLA
ncbi:MAG: MFS transporter [Sphingomonadales bacterium]|nr:MFS transporter [Sphingomonadales bacterium]MDE2171726.1 MFS transporter [Sphingomonadales bacterium]